MGRDDDRPFEWMRERETRGNKEDGRRENMCEEREKRKRSKED